MKLSMKKPNENKWLFFAIGNPGDEFENTYHNAGMMALPAFVETVTGENIDDLGWKTHKCLFTYATVGNFVFANSLTFMNESGRSVAEAVKKFGVAPDHLVILHDDSDITLGDFKLSFDRSSGGHKGAQSIIDHLKTQAFWRARFGVRPSSAKATEGKPARRLKAGDFVLGKLTPTARKKLESVFEKAAKEIKRVVGSR